MCDCHFKNKDGSSWSYDQRVKWPELYRKYFSVMKTPININNDQGKILYINKDDRNLKMYWSNEQDVYSIPNTNFIQYDCTNDKSYVMYDNKKYILRQFHFHSAAENTINRVYQPIEVHFVHSFVNEKSGIEVFLVIGMHLQITKNQEELAPFAKQLLENYDKNVVFDLSIYNTLPETKFYRWLGSLTTPPFSNNIQFNLWSVDDTKFNFLVGIHPNNLYNYNTLFSDSRDLITDEYKQNREAAPLDTNYLAVTVIEKK